MSAPAGRPDSPRPERHERHDPGWLDLEGVVNMRDLGGLPTVDGRSVRPGRLIRSDNLQELPPGSVRHLVDDLHVTDVVDLRTHVEVAKEGDGPLLAEPSVRWHHHTLYPEETAESGIPAAERPLPWERPRAVPEPVAPREADATQEPVDPAERERRHHAFWSGHYLGYLAQRPDSVVAALRVVAGAEGAVVVHCAAGKDRTGTVVGLALLVAGVTPEAVMADYAASAERVPLILDRLARRPAYAANLVGKTVAQQSTGAETMRLLIEALDGEGGPLAWLGRHGWTDADTAALRRRLVGDDAADAADAAGVSGSATEKPRDP